MPAGCPATKPGPRAAEGPEAASREASVGQGMPEGKKLGVRKGGVKHWICRVLQ